MTRQRKTPSGRLFVGMQYLLPQHLLSNAMHALARIRLGPVKDLLIRAFLSAYPVNLAEADKPKASDYESFNAFFTRALRPGVRPVDADAAAIVSPVDGTVSQAGRIERDMLLQAKGIQYPVASLLGGDGSLAKDFENGQFATLYLAPYDYHRIHMPLAGTLRTARFIPGDLFSVNATTASTVPGLFARNERICCLFDTVAGPMAVVLVGALFVGSMSLSWVGEVRAGPQRQVHEIQADGTLLALHKAAELGRFNMGSTVIVMFAHGAVAPVEGLIPGRSVRMGERIATLAR